MPRGRGPAPRGFRANGRAGPSARRGHDVVFREWVPRSRRAVVPRGARRGGTEGPAVGRARTLRPAPRARAQARVRVGGVEPRGGLAPERREPTLDVRVDSLHLERPRGAPTSLHSRLRRGVARVVVVRLLVRRRRVRGRGGRRHREERVRGRGTRARAVCARGPPKNASIPPTPIDLGPLPRNLDFNAPNVRVPVPGGWMLESGRFRVQQTVITKISSVANPPSPSKPPSDRVAPNRRAQLATRSAPRGRSLPTEGSRETLVRRTRTRLGPPPPRATMNHPLKGITFFGTSPKRKATVC